MRTRKKEIDQIVAILDKQHDDVYDLADEVWKLIDDLRRERELYVIGMDHDGIGQFIYGAYESLTMAEKDLSDKGNLKGYSKRDRYRIFKVISSSSKVEEPLELFDSK